MAIIYLATERCEGLLYTDVVVAHTSEGQLDVWSHGCIERLISRCDPKTLYGLFHSVSSKPWCSITGKPQGKGSGARGLSRRLAALRLRLEVRQSDYASGLSFRPLS